MVEEASWPPAVRVLDKNLDGGGANRELQRGRAATPDWQQASAEPVLSHRPRWLAAAAGSQHLPWR